MLSFWQGFDIEMMGKINKNLGVLDNVFISVISVLLVVIKIFNYEEIHIVAFDLQNLLGTPPSSG